MTTAPKALLLFLPFLLLAACNDENDSLTRASGFASPMMELNGAMQDTVSLKSSPSPRAIDRSRLGNKRIAERHDLTVEIDQDHIRTRQQADFDRCLKMQCEILDSNSGKTYGRLSVRIVPDQLPDYLKALEEERGEIVSHNVSVEDKTLSYIDTEADLKNKTALRDRLTKLLDSNDVREVKDLLQIERELARVQREIDSATGRLRHLENETAKARVDISYTVPVYERAIEYKDLQGSFRNAWRGLINSTADVIKFTGCILPWIPVGLIGLWLLFWTLGGLKRRLQSSKVTSK